MDGLEPFRRAAELGCPDFVVTLNGVCFKDMNKGAWYLPGSNSPHSLESTRAFRYAAAVCAEWWESQRGNDPFKGEVEKHHEDRALDLMIDRARAFAKKYGGQ